MKVLWGVTLTASLIFVIQSVMTFLGADADGAFDSIDSVDGIDDPSSSEMGSGANLYTFRNLVNFLLGFGWSAILLQESVNSVGLLLVISVFVGVGLVAAVMYIFKLLSGMQQSGNIDVFKSAVGCNGTAYLSIPAERAGEGKVQITINNAVREYNAVTDGDKIPTGTPVTVVEVIDGQTLLVETKNSLII
ncbi:MAG: hypothetical protein MJY69_01925 [Bacteroidales bacterium]|nr:hypothetical protein [Bacteroidales bacterium]